ncbi:MAG TPA: Uma2 family endonuclease [Chthonomonadaceae bacterium]|nr:Uma2 family endonuclease [Chthonomonadaceae bacterium]
MAAPMTTSQAARKELTYEEYLRLPEIKRRYEILDGEMVMSPAPISDHQWILSELLLLLLEFVRSRKLGVVLPAPVDIIIRKRPKLQTRQPDIVFLSTARTGVRGRKELKQMPQIEIAPDIAVEILSPEEERKTWPGKLADYAEIGVPEVWLARPEEETIEVLQRKAGSYERLGLYGQGETVRSAVLPELGFGVGDIFE